MPPQNIGENPSTLHHTNVDFRSHASRDSVSSTQLRFFDSNSNTLLIILIYIVLAYFKSLVASFGPMTPNHQMA